MSFRLETYTSGMPAVRLTAWPPVRNFTHTSQRSGESTMYAIHLPSGDSAGENSVAPVAANLRMRANAGARFCGARGTSHHPIATPRTAAPAATTATGILRLVAGALMAGALEPVLDRLPAESSAKIRSRADWNRWSGDFSRQC